MAFDTVSKFMSELRTVQAELAATGMLFPKSKKFEHGMQVGKYQGLEQALGILENILRADDEKEKRS